MTYSAEKDAKFKTALADAIEEYTGLKGKHVYAIVTLCTEGEDDEAAPEVFANIANSAFVSQMLSIAADHVRENEPDTVFRPS